MSRWFVRIFVCVALFCPVEMPAQESPESVPPFFRAMIEKSNVELEYNDPRDVGMGGKTTYNYKWNYKTKHKIKSTPLGNGMKQVVIEVDITKFEITAHHKVFFPAAYNSPARWTTPLAERLFDRVGISSDPRVLALHEHLIGGIKEIKANVPESLEVTDEVASQAIKDEIQKRGSAVRQVVKANYELYDKVLTTGLPAAQRRVFFTGLYSPQRLAQLRFPYLPLIGPLVTSREYNSLPLPYRGLAR